jgi:uncharacterized membrane protein
MDGRGGSSDSIVTSHRLESFSDGVMAVVITITAFEIKAPHGASLGALGHEVPLLLVYLLSFCYIGIYWGNHHHLLRRSQRISAGVMWSNLHLLFWLSLMPVLTEWAGTNTGRTAPAAVYGMVAMAAAIAYWILVHTLIGANGGVHGALAASIGSDVKGVTSIVLYAVAIGSAFASPYVAYGVYATVALVWFVPDRRLAP